MTDQANWLTHPIRAWSAFRTVLAERADAEAVAAGLTVEMLANEIRRYRDPRLDHLAAHRAAAAANGRTDRRTERGGPNKPGGAGAVPALTVPRQGRSGFACASPATASGGPGPGTPSSAGS